MNRFALITLRSFGIALAVFLFQPAVSTAQNVNRVAEWLESYRLSGDFREVRALTQTQERADLQSTVENATILEPDQNTLHELLQTAPLTLTFSIPNAYGQKFDLELVKVDLLAPGFSVGTLGTDARDNVPYQAGVHYRGIVRGNPNSLAAVSVFDGEIAAMITDETGAYEVGRLEGGTPQHVLYRRQDLKAASPFNCHADDVAAVPDAGEETGSEDRGVGCKTVPIYFECDYKMFTDKGSNTTNVTNYVTAVFNQVATLYANENVGVAISQIYVWTSPDPYAGYTSTSSVLNAFRTTRGTNFTGNLAHFLSTRSLGGGIAYLDVICFKNYAFGVSAISNSYQNVPTYSWTVEVVTHELGHNLGSWHTQSCNWTGGALDNCYTTEGGCAPGPAPANGGTIMSYCHLTGYGINFNNGFGAQPGNRIRDRIVAATCLGSSGNVPAGLAATNITGSSATLSWGAVGGATNYTVQYKTSVSSTWITAGTTTSPTYNLTGLAANTAYNWQVKTDCSNYSVTANFTTTSGGGGGSNCAAPTGLSTTNIATTSAQLNWGASSGATSYTVQYKTTAATAWQTAGTTGSTSYALGSLSAGTAYNWRVKPNCSSSYSATATFTTLSGGGGGGSCSAPSVLNNLTVKATSAVVSWSSVSGATSYTLQIKYANSSTWYTLGTVGATQVTVSGLLPSTSYHWRVKASCSGYSANKLLTTPAGLENPANGEESLPNVTVSYFQLYPNPAAETLTLSYTGSITASTEVLVTDVAGRIVIRQPLTRERQELDVSQLQDGLYVLLLMEGDRRISTERFVKM